MQKDITDVSTLGEQNKVKYLQTMLKVAQEQNERLQKENCELKSEKKKIEFDSSLNLRVIQRLQKELKAVQAELKKYTRYNDVA